MFLKHFLGNTAQATLVSVYQTFAGSLENLSKTNTMFHLFVDIKFVSNFIS